MNVSAKVSQLLKNLEGFEDEPYQDGNGNWTIGYGHKIVEGDDYKPVGNKDKITKKAANDLLLKDIKDKAVQYINNYVHVDLTQNQFDALVLFVFNIGSNEFFHSSILKFINEGDFEKAASEFQKWVHVDGQRCSGLVARRATERNLFMTS